MINYGFGIDVHGNAIQAMSGIDNSINHLQKHSEHATSEIANNFKEMTNSIKSMAFQFVGIMAAGEFIKSSVEAYNKLDEAEVKLNAQLKATGENAGLNEEALKKMADALNEKVIFPEAQIIEAESMLSMFKSLNKEMYTKTLPIVADVASKFGMAMPEAARLVGRSLENLQLGRLQMRLGNLSDAQKAQIKYFKESGQVAKAQAVMYDFLKTKVGGLSEQLAKTPEGKLKMASKALLEIKIMLGQIFMNLMVNLLPVFKKLVEAVKSWMPEIKTTFQVLTNGILGFINLVEKLWWILKYVVALFVAWKAIRIFDYLMTGAGVFLTTMQSMATAATTTGIAFQSWATALLLDLGIAYLLVDQFSNLTNLMLNLPNAKKMGDKLAKYDIDALLKEREEIHKRPGYRKGSTDDWLVNKKITEYADLMKERQEMLHNLNPLNVLDRMKTNFKPIIDWLKGETKSDKSNPFLPPGGGSDAFTENAFNTSDLAGAKGGSDALTENAFNTSDLAGAKGGLGEAKVINIRMDDGLKIIVPNGDSRDILAHADQTMDVVLRAINNVSHSQGMM